MKNFFNGPESICSGLRPDQQYAGSAAEPLFQTKRRRCIRRIDQSNAAAGFDPAQGRPEQLDFAHTGLRRHDFYEGAQGPSAPRQVLVEKGMTRGNGVVTRTRQL